MAARPSLIGFAREDSIGDYLMTVAEVADELGVKLAGSSSVRMHDPVEHFQRGVIRLEIDAVVEGEKLAELHEAIGAITPLGLELEIVTKQGIVERARRTNAFGAAIVERLGVEVEKLENR